MTEDLIAMARSAGAAKFVHERNGVKVADETSLLVSVAFIERFAALIEARAVARTREECAALCEQWNASHPERIAASIRALGERT